MKFNATLVNKILISDTLKKYFVCVCYTMYSTAKCMCFLPLQLIISVPRCQKHPSARALGICGGILFLSAGSWSLYQFFLTSCFGVWFMLQQFAAKFSLQLLSLSVCLELVTWSVTLGALLLEVDLCLWFLRWALAFAYTACCWWQFCLRWCI